MPVSLICVGKSKDRSLQDLEKEYIKRLQPFTKVSVVEVRDEANARVEREGEARRVKDEEAKRVLEKIGPQDYVVLLDLHGREVDSVAFAKKFEGLRDSGRPLVFVIAGSLGPGEELVKRADWRWKLSDLTFTHLMTRVLVLEQLYRGCMISAGRTYHK